VCTVAAWPVYRSSIDASVVEPTTVAQAYLLDMVKVMPKKL